MHNVKTNAIPMGDILGHCDLVKGHSDLPTMHAVSPLVVHYRYCINGPITLAGKFCASI
jgi:hypothetical protein